MEPGNPTLSHDEVALRAYCIYVEEGCPEDCSERHWHQAEAELNGSRERPSPAEVILHTFRSDESAPVSDPPA